GHNFFVHKLADHFFDSQLLFAQSKDHHGQLLLVQMFRCDQTSRNPKHRSKPCQSCQKAGLTSLRQSGSRLWLLDRADSDQWTQAVNVCMFATILILLTYIVCVVGSVVNIEPTVYIKSTK